MSSCEYDDPPRRSPGVPGWVWWVGGGVLLLALSRHQSTAAAAPAAPIAPGSTQAECLRALVFPTPGADRGKLLTAYQASEGLMSSSTWNEATDAAAERRLGDFGATARAAINSVLERDAFFRLQGDRP